MATKKQFTEFLKDIEPSPTTKTNSSSAHTNLRNFLKEHEEFKEVHINTFLSGSYKRGTAIRPRKKNGKLQKPDVDIIVVTNYSLSDNPTKVINFLMSTLEDAGIYNFVDPPNTRSVGVYTDTVEMDVVPIIAPWGIDSTLYIADSKLDTWLETNPPKHTQWTTEVNNASNGNFKPLVKLFKWWRRHNPTLYRRPKGFVIECLVAENMDYQENDYENLFIGTLESIVNNYAPNISLKTVPFLSDPGVPSNSVTSGMAFEEFEAFYKKVESHLAICRQAQEETDPEKELALWIKIFGDRFPSSNGSGPKSLLRPAIASVATRFPNKPINPRKPAGFA